MKWVLLLVVVAVISYFTPPLFLAGLVVGYFTALTVLMRTKYGTYWMELALRAKKHE